MSAPKLVTLFGMTGLVEASYNAGGSPAVGDDGILLAEPALAELDYIHGGERALNAGSGGALPNLQPSGLFAAFTATIEARGANAAYSATEIPEDLHVMLQASGHSATLDATASAEKYTYAPATASPSSAVFEAFSRGQKYVLTGCYASMGFEVDGGGPMVFSFEVQGLASIPTDVALPAITYDTHVPPKADSISLTLGAYTGAVVRSISFAQNREMSDRLDINSGGHAGFTPGRRNAELTIVIEADDLSAADPPLEADKIDPYTLRDSADQFAVDFTVGTSQYNRIKFNAPQAVITSVGESEDGETATWELGLQIPVSALAADDEYSIVMD